MSFNKSTLQVKEDDQSGSSYVISPTGAKINRIFVVGVLTEVENVRSSEDLWRARIADPHWDLHCVCGEISA